MAYQFGGFGFTIGPTGNIGIRMANPMQALHVDAGVKISGPSALATDTNGGLFLSYGTYTAQTSELISIQPGIDFKNFDFQGLNIILKSGTGAVTESLRCDQNGNVSVGTAALATTATNGFLYIPTCAGTPTGVPTAKTGRIPLIYDTTANKWWGYNGAWRGVVMT